MADNPDRALIAEMMAYGYSDVAVDTNPVFADLGARIISAARGKIALRFSVGKRARQGDGIVHGGVISTMLDGGMAFAVLSMLDAGESAATISLTGAAASGPQWQMLPSVPTGTSVLAAGPDGATDALAVSGSTLTVWRLAPGQGAWSKVQTVNVPIQVGSSG